MSTTATPQHVTDAAQAAWERYAEELHRHNLPPNQLESAELDYKRGFTDAHGRTGEPTA
jgi:hypothetical protein